MNDLVVQSPIVVLVGNKGTGKTTYLTYRAEYGHFVENRTIYSNFKLHNIPYRQFTYDMLKELPEEMRDGIIVADEGQMGADAYAFLSKKSKALTTLATQLRKRNLELWISTQRFKMIASRLRDLSDYIFTFTNVRDENNKIIKGVAFVEAFNREDKYNEIPQFKFTFDGRRFFGHFDSDEVIE